MLRWPIFNPDVRPLEYPHNFATFGRMLGVQPAIDRAKGIIDRMSASRAELDLVPIGGGGSRGNNGHATQYTGAL